jgi:methionyl-tRNA formyltransferase
MKICIAGKNNIAVDSLKFVLKHFNKDQVCVVVNKTENFKNNSQQSLGFFANLLGVKILNIDEVKLLKDIFFFSLEFDQIIVPDDFNSKNLFNIHFSLLPKYKGMYTSLFPILNGDNTSGVTLHEIDRGIDTGDIIDQVEFEISGFSCRELYFEYMNIGYKVFTNNFIKIISEDYSRSIQSSFNSSYFGKKSFNFNDTKINFHQTSFQIHNYCRALTFREYQLPRFKNWDIRKSFISNQKSNTKPGSIIFENETKFLVSTIDFDIELYKDYLSQLFECCKLDNFNKANEIISLIPDLNETSNNGWTPLMVACYHGSINITKLLIENGADFKKMNYNKTSLIMYAKDAFLRDRNIDLIQYLLKCGLKLDHKDIYGKSVIDYLDEDQKKHFNFL